MKAGFINNCGKLKDNLALLVVLMLPVNLAKFITVSDSYVNNRLVDYLQVSIYLTDLIIILYLFYSSQNVKPYIHKLFNVFNFKIFILFLLTIGILLSPSLLYLYKFIKICVLCLFFYDLYKTNFFGKSFEKFLICLFASGILISLLALGQWFFQHSVFNNYLILGEIPYSYKTSGIIRESFGGTFVIPPFGLFPHPNILGGFICLVLLFYIQFIYLKPLPVPSTRLFISLSREPYKSLILLLLFVILFLSFSYSALFTFFICLFFLLIKLAQKHLLALIFLLVLGLSLLSPWLLNSTSAFPSISRRAHLLNISTQMIQKCPLISCVGYFGFIGNMRDYGVVSGSISFYQPVHNIFYLMFAETGLLFGLIFILGLIYLFLKARTFSRILLLNLVMLGSWDHYFLSIQQGQLMFLLTLTFVITTIYKDEFENTCL